MDGITHGVHTFGGCPVMTVDMDVAVFVQFHAGRVAAQVVGVGAPAGGHQQVRSGHARAVLHVQRNLLVTAASLDGGHAHAQPQTDLLLAKYLLHAARNGLVLPGQQVWFGAHDGDRRAETAEHLGHLAADVAAPQHQQVPGQLAQLHHRGVVLPGDRVQPGYIGDRRSPAHVDHHGPGRQPLARHLHCARTDEPGMPPDQCQAIPGFGQPPLNPLTPAGHDGVLAIHHRWQIDRDATHPHAQGAGLAGHVGGPGAGDHRLGGRAASVRAGAAQGRPLHQRHPLAQPDQLCGQRHPRLPASDDNHVGIHTRTSQAV